MKKTFVFLFFVMMASVAFAQAPAHLKGPAAKNYKVWKDSGDEPASTAVVQSDRSTLTGPVAKNQVLRPGRKAGEFESVQSADWPQDLKGPRSKNLKPWERTRITSADIAEDAPKKKANKNSSASGGGR